MSLYRLVDWVAPDQNNRGPRFLSQVEPGSFNLRVDFVIAETKRKYLEKIGFLKCRHYTVFYCRVCRSEIGSLRKQPSKWDRFKLSCDCLSGHDLTLCDVIEYFRPSIDYLKAHPLYRECEGAVRRCRPSHSQVGNRNRGVKVT